MKTSLLYNSFLKNFVHLNSAGILTYKELNDLTTVASNATSLNIKPDKNYIWISNSTHISLNANSVNEDNISFHIANVLLIAPQNCEINIGENINVVNPPQPGKASRIVVEWWGNNIKLYIPAENDASSEESGSGESGSGSGESGEGGEGGEGGESESGENQNTDYKISVLAKSENDVILYEACGNYYKIIPDEDFILYTNGVYSIVKVISKWYLVYRHNNKSFTIK